MGTVPLPNLDDIMQIKDPKQQMEAFVNTVGILIKNLSEINGYLSSKNIKAQSIQTESLAAGSVTADKIQVTELSAITADMGKLTSGEIYGAYIATAEGSYPRAEMSSTGDFFRALASSSVFTEITTSLFGSPAVHSTDGTTTGALFANSLFGTEYTLLSDQDIGLRPGTGRNVTVPSWSQLYSRDDFQTLADALNNLATAIASAATAGVSTSSAGSGTYNGGIPIGTSLAVAGGGSVTWAGINVSSHSHTQN